MRQRDIEFLEAWVYRNTGNVLHRVQGMPVAARVEALADELAMNSSDLFAVVEEGLHPKLEVRLMEAVLNAETLFFRDARFFQGLEAHVLPQLVAARRGERRLRIWSGACSTGQEAYSLAMLLAEHYPELDGWGVEIIATDLSPTRVDRGARGRYLQREVNRGLPARHLVRHFDKRDGEWVVSPRLRARIDFRVQNLIEPWSVVGRFDIIMLRHVLIYFDDDARRSVLTRAHAQLRSDGFLLLGSAESPRPVQPLFVHSRPHLIGCYQPAK